MHIAAKYGQKNTILQLLSCKRCKPNTQNKEGDTPLHFAAEYGQEDIIIQLLHKECDPNVLNKKGDYRQIHHYMLLLIRKNTLPAISQLLGNKQCNPNVVNNDHC